MTFYPGALDAIGETLNEQGGSLHTRLREGVVWGANNASLDVGSPTVLTSPVDVFEADWVGLIIDILPKSTPTGNQGTYVVSSVTDAQNAVLARLDGAAAAFVTEADVHWRMASLRVESTLGFPARDRRMRVWVDREDRATPYGRRVQTPGAQVFEGLGAQELYKCGIIATAASTTLTTDRDVFTSDMVGREIWVLPLATPNGNEGPNRITAYTSAREVTVATAFSADETAAWFQLKTYDDDGYLTIDHVQGSEVIDGSGGYSEIDRMRRAIQVNYAEDEELDWIGAQRETARITLDDERYRCLIKSKPFSPKGTLYGLKMILDCVYPGGGYEIYEDLINFPGVVYILAPYVDGTSETEEGRTFISGEEAATSSSTTAITVAYTPITVYSVRLADYEQDLNMDVLPSAESPAWTFVAESAGTEGTYFSASGGELFQGQAGTDGGRYRIDVTNLQPEIWALEGWIRAPVITTVNGYPWKFSVEDGEREIVLMWDDAGVIKLGQEDETVVASGSATIMETSTWHHVRLERKGSRVYGSVDGVRVVSADAADFSSSSNTRASFGFINNTLTQTWSVIWDNVHLYTHSARNFWNINRSDGVFGGANNQLTSAAALFVAGDSGKSVVVRSANRKSYGIWEATYSSATVLALDGIEHTGFSLSGADADPDGARAVFERPFFRAEDGPSEPGAGDGKHLHVTSVTHGNNGTYEILEIIDAQTAVVSNAGGFTTATNETAKLMPTSADPAVFPAETSVPWELVDASSNTGTTLTLRDALPAATTDVEVLYTSVLSAELLDDETVQNLRVAPDLYYPFYLLDIDLPTRLLAEEITAAGIIPRYAREF